MAGPVGTTTAYGTQGQTLEFDTESTLGTADGSAKDIRFEELTFPTVTRQQIENKPKGRENWADNQDRPITYEAVQEDAISVTANCRLSSANLDPLTLMATVGGMGSDTASKTTAAVTGGTIDTASDAGLPGRAFLVELDDGTYHPVLCTATESGGAVNITMNPPDDATAGNDCLAMQTIYPKQQEITTYGNLKWNTRAENTSVNQLAYQASGCALSSIGTITIEPNTPLKFDFGLHAGDIDQLSDTMDADSLKFRENVPITDCNFEFGFYDAGTGISNSTANLIKAEIDLNYSSVPIPATGGTCLNGIQGYYSMPGTPKITLEMIMDKSRWDDFEGTNAYKYIHFVQPSSNAGNTTPTPAWGFWFPNCFLSEAPVMISDGDYYRMTCVYEGYSANFGSSTINNAQEMAPWYYAVGGYYVVA